MNEGRQPSLAERFVRSTESLPRKLAQKVNEISHITPEALSERENRIR